MKNLFILKLGGSVITDKSSGTFIVRTALIQNIASQIAESFDPHTQRLLIIHGGGSASHAIAKKHSLKYGTHADPQKESAGRTIQNNIHHLQDTIADAFMRAGLPLSIFRSEDIYRNTDGILTAQHDTALRDALDHDMIPLVSGAVIPDITWGHSILSGDTLCAHYAQELPTHTIAFASDVDGVFTHNPHMDSTAQLVPLIYLSDIIDGTTRYTIGGAHTTDITGGLFGKLTSFAPLLYRKHAPKHLFIFNGTHPENFVHLFEHTLESATRVVLT